MSERDELNNLRICEICDRRTGVEAPETMICVLCWNRMADTMKRAEARADRLERERDEAQLAFVREANRGPDAEIGHGERAQQTQDVTLRKLDGEYEMSIHSNPDHRTWARLFKETFPDCEIDEDTMAGWFANAMMAKHDSMVQERPTGTPQPEPTDDERAEASIYDIADEHARSVRQMCADLDYVLPTLIAAHTRLMAERDDSGNGAT